MNSNQSLIDSGVLHLALQLFTRKYTMLVKWLAL